MIEFMVIGFPRSATTWASNWLTTDHSLCFHDLLSNVHYDAWDLLKADRPIGVADTGVFAFPEFLNAHPARKVIVHRALHKVNASLERIGYPPLDSRWDGALNKIEGKHVYWRDLFENPKEIYEFLLQKPFDSDRHKLLCDIEMQPNFAGVTIHKGVTKRILKEIMETLN